MNAQQFKDTLIQALTPGTPVNVPHRTGGLNTDNRGYAIQLWMARETACYIRSRAGAMRVMPAVRDVRSVGAGLGSRTEVQLSFTCPGISERLTVIYSQRGAEMVLIIERDTPIGPEPVWRAHGRESRQNGGWTIRTLETA